MSDPIVIRASSLPGFLDCQLRAAVSTLSKAFAEHGHWIGRARSNIGAMVGSGVHGGAEVALKEKMASGALAPISTLEDAGIAAFRERMASDEGEGLVMDDDSPDVDTAERQIRRMVARYREDVAAVARPVSVESRVEAELEPGVILSGQGDLLHLDGRDGGRNVVRDTKTGRRRQSPAKHLAQIGAYSLLYRSRLIQTDSAQIDFVRRAKIADPQPPVEEQPLDLRAAEDVAWAVLNDFAAKAVAFVKDGNPARFLCNPAADLCSPRFCRAFGSKACAATRGLPRE